MINPLEKFNRSTLDLNNLEGEVVRYFENDKNQAYVIYACDARVLYLLARQNIHASDAYTRVSKILSDGRPIYWLTTLLFNFKFDQITGPGFMNWVLENELLRRKRHMFYGGGAETIKALHNKCIVNNVNVVLAVSPPFLDVDNLDVCYVNDKIKLLEIDFFWCGLGAPKQEYLIYQLDQNTRTIMTGVGLAFDYYVGSVKKPPRILSVMGLEWLVRYGQQPKRLRRFIRPFFYVLTLLFLNLFNQRNIR